MRVRIIIIIFVLTSNLVNSQVTQEWVRNYPGLLDKGAGAVKVLNDNSNNIYVLGDCLIEVGTNFRDLVLIKYNPAGVEQWLKVYNNPDNRNDIPGGMAIDNSGNIVITGSTFYPNIGFFNTIKYTPGGNQSWEVQYNSVPPSQLYNEPVSIQTDNSSNVYVTAISSYKQQVSDYLTVKYNSNGVLQWASRFSDGADYPYDMKLDDHGNIYVTGYSTSDSIGYDIKTIKYNNSGVLQWIRKHQSFLATPTNSECKLAIDNDGNVYVAGTCYGPFGLWDMVLIKYKTDGTNSWTKFYGTSHYDKFHTMTIDTNNEIYVSGFIGTPGNETCFVTRYDSSGNLTKEIVYDGPGHRDYPIDIITDSQRNIYVTGYCFPVVSNNSDFLTLKYDSSGTQKWVKTYNGNGNGRDEANSISLDNNNNVFVAGVTRDTAVSVMTTIKYSQSTGIQTLTTELPQKFSLSQNYPNPFNPSTKIRFQIAKATNVKLVVYDALGREVSVLANENMQPGSYVADFDAEGLPTGVYFYRLATSDFVETKRMILLK